MRQPITARMAGEQGREVMAVPGHPLDPRAEGTNRLLKDGATLVTEAADVLSALEMLLAPPQPAPADLNDLAASQATYVEGSVTDEARSLVLSALGPAPVKIDELARATGLGIRNVRAILLELALSGRIEQHGSQLVSLNAQ